MALHAGNRHGSLPGYIRARDILMKPVRKPLVTLILPVYNEDRRLSSGLRLALAYLSKQPYTWEIRVVDDGSATPAEDIIRTSGIIPFRKRRVPLFIHRLGKNRGKGAAIAYGVQRARGKYIVFSDIDFSVKIETLSSLMAALKKSPVVIGSRRAPGSVIGTHQPILRETVGRLFTYFANTLLGLRVFDSTCGFKGFERRAAKRLFGDLVIGRWVFDAEVLWRARHWGMPIVQIPVHWSDKKGTHVHIPDVLRAWIDLFRLWVYAGTHT